MSLDVDRSAWKRVSFGEVADRVRSQIERGDVDRYVAGGHFDDGSLEVTRWGNPDDGGMGSTFTYGFLPGHTLFVSASWYLRKIAVATFEGVVADKTYVLAPRDPSILDPRFLPFILLTDRFHEYAAMQATGSMNARLLWSALAKYEFDLPPLDQQRRIADLLWSVENEVQATQRTSVADQELKEAWLSDVFGDRFSDAGRTKLDSWVEAGRPICYGVLKPGPEYENGPLVVDVKDYPRGTIQVGSIRHCDPQIESGFSRSRLRKGDVLLSIRGTIGRVALVPEELHGANISRDSARISIDMGIADPRFVKALLESQVLQRQMTRRTTGLAVKGLNVAVIRDFEVPSLSLQEQRAVLEELAWLERLSEALEIRRKALGDLRYSLLTHLLGARR